MTGKVDRIDHWRMVLAIAYATALIGLVISAIVAARLPTGSTDKTALMWVVIGSMIALGLLTIVTWILSEVRDRLVKQQDEQP